MKSSLPEHFEAIANEMGITLFQRFSMNEAALFLRCPERVIEHFVLSGKLNCIRIADKDYQFLGYQLLEFLQNQSTDNNKPFSQPSGEVDRVIRIKEVESMTGLKRVTIWRRENAGNFPRRVSLGGNSVGWRLSEVQNWISQL